MTSRRRRRAVDRHLDLHDRPGVGPVAWQRVGRAAAIHQVPVSGVVVVRRGAGRDRRRGVVVEDQGLARVGAEVNDDIRALRCHEEQRVLVDDAEIEVGRVEVVPDRLLRDHDRRRREATLGADLDPRRSCRCRIGNAARRVGVLVCRGDTDRDHLDLGAVRHGHGCRRRDGAGVQRAVAVRRRSRLVRSDVELQVLGPVVGGVQDAEPDRLLVPHAGPGKRFRSRSACPGSSRPGWRDSACRDCSGGSQGAVQPGPGGTRSQAA